jgi:hypothetical protein
MGPPPPPRRSNQRRVSRRQQMDGQEDMAHMLAEEMEDIHSVAGTDESAGNDSDLEGLMVLKPKARGERDDNHGGVEKRRGRKGWWVADGRLKSGQRKGWRGGGRLCVLNL